MRVKLFLTILQQIRYVRATLTSVCAVVITYSISCAAPQGRWRDVLTRRENSSFDIRLNGSAIADRPVVVGIASNWASTQIVYGSYASAARNGSDVAQVVQLPPWSYLSNKSERHGIVVAEHAVGFPFRSARSYRSLLYREESPNVRVPDGPARLLGGNWIHSFSRPDITGTYPFASLPHIIIWRGVAYNLLIWFIISVCWQTCIRVLVCVHRMRRFQCLTCGYNLAGLVDSTCPECGIRAT